MRSIVIILVSCLAFSVSVASASDEQPTSDRTAAIGLLMERAISCNLIEGGVVVIGNHDGILGTTARGRLNALPGAPLLNERTMFDLASLTKVIATTPAVMKLLDDGQISLLDPVTRWFPEFTGSGHEDITILNLLTHTSGLADFDLRPWQGMETAIRKAAAEKTGQRPGTSFNYADINFILLGELVHRVSGRSLDVFCHQEIYEPLDAQQTMFRPPENLAAGIAPTLGMNSGIVQDRNSRRLGGVAGHAGLFSSAGDLARFARLLLGRGMIDGRRILSERVVAQMTAPYFYSSGTVIRGLGWDIDSPYSAPKGMLFSQGSFGHTGYSGSSIWIDPYRDLFVILLTNRLNYHDTRMFNQLRRDVSTIAAAEFAVPGDDQGPSPRLALAKIAGDLLRPATQAKSVRPRAGKHFKLAAAARKRRAAAHHVKKIARNSRHKVYRDRPV